MGAPTGTRASVLTVADLPRSAVPAPGLRVRRALLGALHHVWWVVRLLLADVLRRPARRMLGLVLLALGVSLWWLGSTASQRLTVVGYLLGLAVLLGVWRRLAPGSFGWWVGRWWGVWWRRRFVYGPSWKHLALRHNLVVRDRPTAPGLVRGLALSYAGTAGAIMQQAGMVEVARLKRVRVSPRGDHLLIVLPSGLTPDAVAAACGSLAHAWRVVSVRCRVGSPGFVWLDVLRRDTLAAPVLLDAVPGIATPAQLVHELSGLRVGVLEDGRPWRVQLRGAHLLVAGTTGSGKSSLLWAILAGLAQGIRSGLVRVTWLDPKGGMEALPARPLADVVDRIDVMADRLEALVVELDERSARMATSGLRMHVPSVVEPHRVVIVDEQATLTALADSKTARRVEAALGALLSRGRAVGFTCITTTVDPSKEVVRWRGLYAIRAAFRLDEPVQVDMVLGDGARGRGAVCDGIPLSTPGVCFVRIEGVPEPVRARAMYVSDQAIEAVTRTFGTSAAATPTAQLHDTDTDTDREDQDQDQDQDQREAEGVTA